jgi:2-dehydro-3-deoxyphosphogalactonate aldolase
MRNLIAILRGVKSDEVEAIVEVLLEAGIQKIEIPLNSPKPFDSIERMVQLFEGRGVFGAGTVLHVYEVNQLNGVGAQMVVSPNCDTEVIKATKKAGMLSYPGVMTPSECFTALEAGADALKFFPGELVTPTGLKAMRAVLPPDVECFAVGGAKPQNFNNWQEAGANGFGIGSAIYKAGDDAKTVSRKAQAIANAYDKVMI